MRILFLSSEVYPYSKTGGLADVASALPKALRGLGHEVFVVTPFYRGIDPAQHSLARRLRTLDVPVGDALVKVGLYEGRLAGSAARIYLLDHPASFDRAGLYGEGGVDYPDNARRFLLLSSAALELGRVLGLRPDIVHANDWQTAMALWLLKREHRDDERLGRARAVLTVHNLAFQGLFDRRVVEELDLGWENFTVGGFEFWGKVSFLKAGLVAADLITTVSPTYAREIQTREHGCGLEGLLGQRSADLVGILNGVDHAAWSPAADRHLAARYTPLDLEGKRLCKHALQKRLGLPLLPRTPLFGAVSWLTEQKGFDLVAELDSALADLDLQLVVLGPGEPALEQALLALGRRHPDQVAVVVGYDEALAHQIQAGSDFCLMPSRFEPCGINAIHALRYGALPVVRATGALEDTVVDFDPVTGTGNGFKFGPASSQALLLAMRRALACYHNPPLYTKTQRRAMQEDHSFDECARKYVDAYQRALG